jgi:hypothetical protein
MLANFTAACSNAVHMNDGAVTFVFQHLPALTRVFLAITVDISSSSSAVHCARE